MVYNCGQRSVKEPTKVLGHFGYFIRKWWLMAAHFLLNQYQPISLCCQKRSTSTCRVNIEPLISHDIPMSNFEKVSCVTLYVPA